MNNSFVEVLFPVSGPGCFTYKVPSSLQKQVKIGSRVLAELQHRKIWGVVCGQSATSNQRGIKEILSVDAHVFGEPFIRFLLWLSDYYFARPGDVLRTLIPKSLQRH